MLHKNKFFAISYIEGAAVMAAEICGAKIIAPFFGSSLYVWSSVMAITLGGLASGYFLGGQLSKKHNSEKYLLLFLVLSVCCISIMPLLTPLFLFVSNHFKLIPAVIISVCFLLFPTTICMGTTSPLIISILTKQAHQSGEISGKIYAISTLGGITATFLCGFYLIPNYGVTYSLFIFATLLSICCIGLIPKKKTKTIFFLFCILSLSLFGFIRIKQNTHTIYKSESMLGKLEVRDGNINLKDSIIIRRLLINNIIQTEMQLSNHQSISEYEKLIKKNMPFFPKGKALLLGLGGGVEANMLVRNHYQVTAVEFDERIIDISKRFFYLNQSVKTICTDARYYLNTTQDKFNIVFFDLFKGEEQPAHVITKQSLVKLKTLLNKNSVILINTYGYLNGIKGLGTQCLLSTLKQAGFNIKICTYSKDENYRNLLIIASLLPFNTPFKNELPTFPITNNNLINEDDKPILEYLNASANQQFRSLYLNNYILNNY